MGRVRKSLLRMASCAGLILRGLTKKAAQDQTGAARFEPSKTPFSTPEIEFEKALWLRKPEVYWQNYSRTGSGCALIFYRPAASQCGMRSPSRLKAGSRAKSLTRLP
jgi:hypothetical protein